MEEELIFYKIDISGVTRNILILKKQTENIRDNIKRVFLITDDNIGNIKRIKVTKEAIKDWKFKTLIVSMTELFIYKNYLNIWSVRKIIEPDMTLLDMVSDTIGKVIYIQKDTKINIGVTREISIHYHCSKINSSFYWRTNGGGNVDVTSILNVVDVDNIDKLIFVLTNPDLQLIIDLFTQANYIKKDIFVCTYVNNQLYEITKDKNDFKIIHF